MSDGDRRLPWIALFILCAAIGISFWVTERLAFLNFFTTTPAEHVPFSAKVSFDSNNAAAANLIPAEERRFRPSWPDNWSKLVVADYEWIATNRAAMRERWISWLTR